MERAILQRTDTGDTGTFGVLTTARGLVLRSLELPWRDIDGDGLDDRSISCIRPGRYTCRWVRSPRFGRHYYRIDDAQVAPRFGILIHPGNWAGDKRKGLRSSVEGCIALGLRRGDLQGQPAVLSSTDACERLADHFGRQPFELTVRAIRDGVMP